MLPDPEVLGPLLAYYGGDPASIRHRRAHYAAMAVKSAQGAEERDWHEYDRAYVTSVGVADDRRRGGGAGARPHRAPRSCGAGRSPSLAALAGARTGRRAARRGVERQRADRGVLRRRGVCQVGAGAGRRVLCSSTATSSASPSPIRRSSSTPPCTSRTSSVTRIAYVGDSVTMDIGGATRGRPPSDPCRPLRRPPRRRLRPHQVARTTLLGDAHGLSRRSRPGSLGRAVTRRRAITLRHSVSSAPSKIDSTRASTNRRLTGYSSA